MPCFGQNDSDRGWTTTYDQNIRIGQKILYKIYFIYIINKYTVICCT